MTGLSFVPAPELAAVERMPWETFVDEVFNWQQGEHVSLIGPTGCGKTTLALSILEMQRFTTVFGTKPEDATLQRLVRRKDWQRIKKWEQAPNLMRDRNGKVPDQRLVLWPPFKRIEDQLLHPHVFDNAMRRMFVERGWTVFADETYYLSRRLKLSGVLETWWMQGRSIKSGLMAATQRPAWVPLELYSQATHLFLWQTNDTRDVKRLSDIGGPRRGTDVGGLLSTLDFRKHELLYVDTRDGTSVITIPPK